MMRRGHETLTHCLFVLGLLSYILSNVFIAAIQSQVKKTSITVPITHDNRLIYTLWHVSWMLLLYTKIPIHMILSYH